MFSDREPTSEEYREILESHILRHGLSQAQFCLDKDLNQSTLSSILTGRIRGSAQYIKQLAMTLEYSSVIDLKKAAVERNVYGFDAVSDCLEIGQQRTLWYRANGNGRAGQELTSKNTRVTVTNTEKSIFTSELQRLLFPVERHFMSGEIPHSDKKVYAINRMKVSPQDESGLYPLPVLDMDIVEIPYHAFYGLINNPDCKSYRHRMLQGWLPKEGPIPEISLGLGINVAIISKDERFIVAKRHSVNVGARPGQLDVGAVEGVRPEDIRDGTLDVEQLAYRAVEEEYDLQHDSIEAMHIFGIGYDLFYGQWNFIGVCYVKEPAQKIEPRRKSFAVDEYENEKTHHLIAEPDIVFNFISKQPKVWSCALATSLYAMVHMHGSSRVIEETEKFRLRNPGQYHVSRIQQ